MVVVLELPPWFNQGPYRTPHPGAWAGRYWMAHSDFNSMTVQNCSLSVGAQGVWGLEINDQICLINFSTSIHIPHSIG